MAIAEAKALLRFDEGFTHLALDVEVRLQIDGSSMNPQKRVSLANDSDLA
jgi:hypothetical protein